MKRVALALSCATVALALRPVPPPPRAVQSKAAKKVAAGMAAAVLAGTSTLPLSSLALSADDYDAIYGMSATGSKGSSIKFEMPRFGGDDASDTSAADKKKAKVGRRPAGHLYSRPASLHASAHACAAAAALPPSLLPTRPLPQGAGDGG